MCLLVLIVSLHENAGGCAQVRSVEDIGDQSCGGEGVRAQQHGQRVVTVASGVSLKHNLKTKRRTDQHIVEPLQDELVR